jgi:hypothetical protein
LTNRIGQESICSQCNGCEGQESDLHGCCWIFEEQKRDENVFVLNVEL